MSFAIQYRTLCTVHCWHDFALARGTTEFAALSQQMQDQILRDYAIHNWLQIEPTAQTQELLRRHQLRFVPRPTGFLVAGSVKPGADPANLILTSTLPDDFALRFTATIIRSSFSWETNAVDQTHRGSILLFTNRSGNNANDELHLTSPLPAFDSAKAYRAGDLVVDSDGAPSVLLETTEDQSPAAAPDLARWTQLPSSRYGAAIAYQAGDRALHSGTVFEAKIAGTLPEPPHAASWRRIYDVALRTGTSSADSLHCLARVTRFALDPPPITVNLTVRDRAGAVVYSDSQFRRDGQPIHEAVLVLETLPPGRYKLEAADQNGVTIPDLPASFYLHPESVSGVPFAVIELVNPPGPFQLFDAAGSVLAPVYHIRFRHRYAFWRYTFRGDLSDLPPADPGDVIQEDPADNSRYTTRTPLPLNLGTVNLKKFGPNRLLPNPASPTTRRENGKLYADTYLTT
jgi:hypothetical protein